MNTVSNELQERKRHNLGWVLFALSAVFWVMNRYRSQSIAMAGYVFTSLIAFPGLFALLGREAKERAKQRDGLIASGIGMILLGYAQKVALFWVETILGRAPAFHPFSTSGAPWFFLVGGVYLILAGVVRKKAWMKRWLLPLTVLLGLGIGVIKHIGDDLCLSRTLVYLPFFVLGFQLNVEKLEQWSRSVRNKLLSLGALGGAAAFCLLCRSKWGALRGLIDGNKAYTSIGGITRIRLGPFYRLSYYLAAAVLLLAVYCLVPACKVRLFSEQGKRWKSGYFWFSVTVLLMTLPLGGGLSLWGAVAAGLLCLAGLVIAPSKWMNRLPDAILNAPERLQKEVPEQQAPENALHRGSFYQRHRWGIRLTAIYTGCFLVAAMGFVFPFFANDSSLVWQMDGLHQQYPLLLYTKRYLLETFQHFLSTGALRFPQWDFTMGFGMPVADNIRREPFALLCFFATEKNLEVLFDVITVLRMYVCGLSFLWYCKVIGKREQGPIVMGALVYVFSGFGILAAIRQPSFVTTMMTYFVIMLIGVERYLQKKKPALFVAIVFLQFFNNYYATYINSLLMAIYLLLRLWMLYGKDIRSSVRSIIRLVGYYLWGMMLSMGTLLPTMISFLSSGRSGGEMNTPAFYSKTYYLKLLTGLNLEAGGSGYRAFVSFASMALLACVLLFLKRRKELRPLKIAVCIAAVFICLPIFGSIFNGFSYVTNRWCYVIGFLMGLILVELTPELLRLGRRERLGLTVFTVAYGAVVVANEDGLTKERYMGLVVLGLTTILILMLREFVPGRRLQTAVLALATVVNVTFSTAVAILPEFGNYNAENAIAGKVDTALAGSMRAGLSVIDDDSFYRIARPLSRSNQSLLLDYYGVNTYYSVLDGKISDFYVGIGLNTQYQTFCIGGLDERSALTELASVKYYVTNTQRIAPYGFRLAETVKDEETGKDQAYVYENPYALPLGYTYTSYLSQVDYDNLSPLERQQVMLDHVVWDGGSSLLEKGEVEFREERIPCTISKTENMDFDETEKTISTGDGAALTLTFEGKPNCETYLVIEGLRDTASGSSKSTVRATMNGITKESALYSKSRNYYFDRDAVTYHFGYSDEAQNQCVVRFASGHDIVYKDIYVVCIPVERYETQAAKLGEVVLENVVERHDRISGTIDLEEGRMLVFSIPAADGWTAYVNGEKRPLEVVNEMYWGLLLEPGSYEIELRYVQPGHTAGNVISAVAFAALIPVAAGAVLRRRKERRQARS